MKYFTYRAVVGCIVLLVLSVQCIAQSEEKITTYDSVFVLSEIEVKNSRLTTYASANVTDSVAIQLSAGMSLAQQLAYQTSLFVRSYGLGSLATTSLRGGSSAHTAVFWNGVNLQSPMNGTLDLALLPVFFTDSVYVQYGGNGALWGSGAMGGAIHLKNRIPQKGVKSMLWAETGSFGQFQQGVGVHFSDGKKYTVLKLWNQQATNNFLYRNRAQFGNPKERQENAALSTQGLTFEQQLNGSIGAFKLGLWWQQAERQIPASLTVKESFASQNDESLRLSFSWNKHLNRQQFSIRTAYLQDDLFFADPAIGLADGSKSHQWNSEIKWEANSFGNFQFLSGIQHIFEKAQTDNYGMENPQRNRLAWATSAKWNSDDTALTLLASARQEWTSVTSFAPFIPSVGAVWQVNDALRLKGSINRSFRLPTFNDLFWQPGGNPGLKAEIGWAQELTASFQQKENQPYFEAVLFNKNLDNQIVWQPTEGGYWAPSNLKSVWVRGAEFSGKYAFALGELKVTGKAIYQLMKVSNRGEENGEQAILYTPENQYRFYVGSDYKNFNFSYSHQLTGKRYTTTDFSGVLPQYHTAQLNINSKINYKKIAGKLWFSVNNLWNAQYEIIAWRPMPGRSYTVGVQLSFHSI